VLLGTKNNYDSERAIRRRLKSLAPDLGQRLEFDSEAGSFCANATSRSDLQQLAGIIRCMTAVTDPEGSGVQRQPGRAARRPIV